MNLENTLPWVGEDRQTAGMLNAMTLFASVRPYFRGHPHAIVAALAVLLTTVAPLSAQKVGLTDPFDAVGPSVSLGYMFLEGDFDGSTAQTLDGSASDSFKLRQQVVSGRIAQQVGGRFQGYIDVGIAENRLSGARFESGGMYGGGLHVLLLPDPHLYLKWVSSFHWHEEVGLRRDSDTRMQIRNDWQTGFLLAREGGPQPLFGEEITGSRTYIGGVYSGREFRLRADGSDTYEPEDWSGLRGLVGIQFDLGRNAGIAVEGHLGSAKGGSGWIYYRF